MILDQHQAKASNVIDGHHFVSSPAGSGKTRTSLERIKNLIEHGVPENRILFITFSKRATNEMKDKLTTMIGENKVYVSTIHSMCYQLYKYLTKKRMQVLSDYKKKRIIIDIFKSNHMPKDELYKIINQIDMLKSNNIYYDEPEKVIEFFNCNEQNAMLLFDVFEKYESIKENMFPEGIDFSDMMFKLYRLLINNSEHMEKVKNIWDYILVDEFQDTSELQFRIIKILSSKCSSLYVIGDANQSIYAWRNANPDFMANFDKYVHNSQKIRLQYTYRCAKKINNIANLLIEPEDHALSATGLTGSVTYIKNIPNEFYEAKIVGQLIMTKHEDKDIKILYRTNAQSMALEVELAKQNIPYKLLGQQQFFERKEVKDIMAYMDVIYNKPKKLTESWLRIINRPNRYLGNSFKDQLDMLTSTDTVLNSLESYRFNRKYMNENAHRLAILINGYTNDKDNVDKLIEYILQQTDYLSWIESQSDNTNKEDQSNSKDIIHEFKLLACSMLNTHNMLNMLKVRTDVNAKVELMSIHKSKGLEADTVFILDVDKNIMPHFMNNNMKEEQNLLYVATTRAKNNLYILHTSEYNGKARDESVFITNISSEPEFCEIVDIIDYNKREILQ